MKFSIRKKIVNNSFDKRFLMIFGWLQKCHVWGHSLDWKLEKIVNIY